MRTPLRVTALAASAATSCSACDSRPTAHEIAGLFDQ